jgi:alanine racemase
VPASLANSSGIFLKARPLFDLVRPGYALYGGNPTPAAANPMRPVVTLSAPILQVRDVPAGATVGYNAAWIAPRPSRLATLSIGYADGWPRVGGDRPGRGFALVDGQRCPFVGRVSMDLAVIDVTEMPAGAAVRGASATVLGGELTVDAVAAEARDIGYALLVGLGRRYRRRYLPAGAGA